MVHNKTYTATFVTLNVSSQYAEASPPNIFPTHINVDYQIRLAIRLTRIRRLHIKAVSPLKR